MLDYNKLYKDIAAKTTIEDSVEVLLLGVINELLAHPGDNDKNIELAADVVNHIKALASAVVTNT